MSGTRRGWMLLAVLVASMGAWLNTAEAQMATTTVQDTVYSANGTPASGTVLLSWGAFTTAGGQSVPSGSTSVTLGAGGLLTIALAPNAGSTPMGSYYTAVFHLSDGTTSRQYWVVPVTVPGGGSATLAAIKSQVLPISVAMQTVSKQYVDNAIAAAVTGAPISSSTYVLTAGSAMTGPLVLPADPVNTNQAADKHYVDTSVAAVSAGLNQKVSVLPTATQVLTQPSGTNFGINGASASTTFTGTGISAQSTITAATAASNPGVSSYTQHQNLMNCYQQGYNLGNNGTSAQGWSTCSLYSDIFESAIRGISQLHAGQFSHMAQGDTAAFYTYLTAFGGNVASSDEAVTHTVNQTHQVGYYSGPIASGGTTGSNLVVASSMTCNGFCLALANGGNVFADGGILLDTSKGGAIATIASAGRAMNGMYYTLASGSVMPSTAWGSVIPSSCTNNGNGQNQVYTTTTCNVSLGTSPASPGSFVAGQDIFLAGPFQEEAAVTAVGVASGGVQSVTFNTRYAWNVASNAALVMQGGPGGQSFVATGGAWPVAYAVVGATSSTQVFFSNCLTGACNVGGNIIQAPLTQGGSPVNLTRASNIVTMNTGSPSLFPVGSSAVVTGCSLTDLNGTFTVVTNSEDTQNNSVTWNQTGANETGGGCTLAQAPPSITFYPSAFITGVDSGLYGAAQLATNTVPWTNGDKIVGAPTSQYQQAGLIIYQGQNTATTGGNASLGVLVDDNGPSQLTHAYEAFNVPGNGVGQDMFNIQGSYGTIFNMGYRPANNGTILYVGGGEPVSSNPKPYYIFQDNQDNAAKFGFDPLNHYFTMNGPLHIGTGTVCTSTNAVCGAGSGGVSSVGVGSWPSWLTPTVTNATTTPSIAVTASAIPNAALANSATTVNGQICALGSTCSVPAVTTATKQGDLIVAGTVSGSILDSGVGKNASATPMGASAAGIFETKNVAELWGFGDSFIAGYGATSFVANPGGNNVPATSAFGLLGGKLNAPAANWAVGGTTAPQIALSAFANFAPSPAIPSVTFMNGGTNDGASYDTCGGAAGTNCVKNFQNAMDASIAWLTIPQQYRTMACGSSCTYPDLTIPLYASPTLASAGGAFYLPNSGYAITLTLPVSATATKVGLTYGVTNAGAGTMTVTVDGVSVTDMCSGTTTFSSGPCGGVALANSTSAPFRQEFTVAASSTAHTITVTSTSAARFPIISADIIPPGGTANENVVFYENILAIAAWTNNATYNAATSSVISQEAGAGLLVYLVDINTAANGGTGVPGMATPTDISGTATTTCPSTTFGNHPNDCGYADIEATVENKEDAVGYRFSIPTSGTVTANNGKFSVPLQVQVASTNFKSAYSNMNTANIIGSGELDYTGGSEVGRGFGHDGSTGLPWSGAYGEKVFSNQSGHWFLAQLFDGSTAWGESHFTTKWGVNLGTGSSYQLGQAEAPLFEQKIGAALASAATIAPVAGITHITGTMAMATITPPMGMSSTVGGCITFIADGAWSTATGGNITTVLTAVAGTLYQACYDGVTWYLK